MAWGAPVFRKKTYRLPELAADVRALLPHARDIDAIWRRRRMAPELREAIMVAVARTNACRWCSFMHTRWGAHVGLSEDALLRIVRRSPEAASPLRWVALEYARAATAGDFRRIPQDVAEEAAQTFTEQERGDILVVARVMTVANRSANTFDALLSRMRGAPSDHSRLVDELVIGGLTLAAIPGAGLLLAALERRSPLRLIADFRAFSRAFEAELREAPVYAGPRPATAPQISSVSRAVPSTSR